ncbi:MAG: hypothetical protein QG671_1863 [Actinomycetota bacterium]|nr:hypothetical protein [Actinomycetota bacterium]
MGRKASSTADSIVGLVIGGFILWALIPKAVWIGLVAVAGIAVAVWITHKAVTGYRRGKAAAEKQAQLDAEAEAARVKREAKENARRAKQQRIEELGAKNAAVVESAQAAVQRIVGSEAADAGWLGDVDFTADLDEITESFRKVHALRKVADELSALAEPSADDHKILAEAQAAAADLENDAVERVSLIEKCAAEAGLVDESLRVEREAARTAEQRAQLHAKLSSMLYGIEATPDMDDVDSTADAVMCRVQAYREIKSQIQLGR